MDSHEKLAIASSRLPSLDILRAVAIFLVFGPHMWMWPVPPSCPEPIAWGLNAWKRGGWIGVDLFFVLSGFLVSNLMFAEYRSTGRIIISRFYVRRGWKIYPPYLCLIVATLAACRWQNISIDARAIIADLFFLQGYIPGLWGHTWSLAVEEHFYLLLPLVLLTMIRLEPTSTNPFARRLPLVVAGFAVVELALRLVTASWWGGYNSHRTHLFPTHLRLDSLFFGVLLAYWYHFNTKAFFATQAKWGRWLLFGGIALIVPAFIFTRDDNEFVYTFGFTSNYIGSSAVLVGMLSINVPENRIFRSISTVGRNSYSIYLWHIPFIVWGIPQIEIAYGSDFCYVARVTLFVVGSVVLGIIMANLIEGPTLRLRDRWFPSRIGKFENRLLFGREPFRDPD